MKLTGKKETHRVPVPEGFLLFVYDRNGQLVTSYFFPNFINYDSVIWRNGKKLSVDDVIGLYQLPGIQDLFTIPCVTQNPSTG